MFDKCDSTWFICLMRIRSKPNFEFVIEFEKEIACFIFLASPLHLIALFSLYFMLIQYLFF